MRPEFLVPDELAERHPTTFARELTRDVLGLVGVTVPWAEVRAWTRLELAMAYDWAWREHLSAADQLTMRRDKPEFVRRAELLKSQGPDPSRGRAHTR